jgi:hypothetical protein
MVLLMLYCNEMADGSILFEIRLAAIHFSDGRQISIPALRQVLPIVHVITARFETASHHNTTKMTR